MWTPLPPIALVIGLVSTLIVIAQHGSSDWHFGAMFGAMVFFFYALWAWDDGRKRG